MSKIVTPTLFVGHDHSNHRLDAEPVNVNSAEAALYFIGHGASAALPDEHWEAAETVLVALGSDPKFAKDLVRMAQHGRWLPRPVGVLV